MSVRSQQGNRARPFNLNLLPVLRELLRQRNVTSAAAALNMSQSAASDALARLRAIFDDELLLPSGRTFVLSKRAEALQALLNDALTQIEDLLNATEFNPERAKGRIHFATSDYVTLTLGTRLVRRLRKLAPALQVQFHDADEDSINALTHGYIDFVLLPEEALADRPDRVEQEFIFDDRLVLTAGAHMDATSSHSDLDWNGQEVLSEAVDDIIRGKKPAIRYNAGDGARKTYVLHRFMLLPFVANKADVQALVPLRLAEQLAPATGTRIVEPSVSLQPLRVFAAWMASRSEDPLHQWLLDQMREIGAELSGQGT